MSDPIISVDVTFEDDRTGQDELIERLTENVSHVDIGIHSISGEALVVIAGAHEFGAQIQHPGGQPFIIVDETKTAKQRAGMSRKQRSARVPLEGGKVLIFLKKGKKGMGVTKPHEIIIPARSFVRSTVDARQEEYQAMAVREWNAILDGSKGMQEALALMGLRIQADIQNTVRMMSDPPLKPETVRVKGSDQPLVDFGTMVNSIRYAVKNRQDRIVEISP